MKCRSPFLWFLQCLKSTWRLLFGRKRVNSGSGQGLISSSESGFIGITVNTITPVGSSGLQLANEDESWNSKWEQNGHSPTGPSRSVFSAHPAVAGPRTSAADAWRQAQVQQKAAPPETVEEPNFFDSMAPKVQKQKIIRLRSEGEDTAAKTQSSRLAFNAAVPPPVNQFDWMEDESPASNWEAAIDDLDPKEIRKAQRNAQSAGPIHPPQSSRPK